MASKMSEVQRTIERGGLWQQIAAIALLRLTPVVSEPCYVCVCHSQLYK